SRSRAAPRSLDQAASDRHQVGDVEVILAARGVQAVPEALDLLLGETVREPIEKHLDLGFALVVEEGHLEPRLLRGIEFELLPVEHEFDRLMPTLGGSEYEGFSHEARVAGQE